VRARLRTPLSALLVAVIATTAAACGGSDDKSGKAKSSDLKAAAPDYAGAVATPPKPAPALALDDFTGKKYDISQRRGKVVLVTFLYTHCPDVCPLITSNLRIAQTKLGAKAKELDLVAVTVDPKRDDAKQVKKFVSAHDMLGRMHYLVGSRTVLGQTWKSWGITAEPDSSNPELIEHAAPIYGVAASGRITTLYPANFKPEQIIHDVPLLAKQ
jgi:protein SCO1/2